MKNGRRNTLNLEADQRFGDPTAVSDPACWISGPLAEALKTALPDQLQMLKHATRYQDNGVLDVSAEVDVDQDGTVHSKL